jgi:hypothetical protein
MCKSVGKLLLIPFTTNSNVYYRHGNSVGTVVVTVRITRKRFRSELCIALQLDLLKPTDLQYMGAGIAFCGEKSPKPRNDPSPWHTVFSMLNYSFYVTINIVFLHYKLGGMGSSYLTTTYDGFFLFDHHLRWVLRIWPQLTMGSSYLTTTYEHFRINLNKILWADLLFAFLHFYIPILQDLCLKVYC